MNQETPTADRLVDRDPAVLHPTVAQDRLEGAAEVASDGSGVQDNGSTPPPFRCVFFNLSL